MPPPPNNRDTWIFDGTHTGTSSRFLPRRRAVDSLASSQGEVESRFSPRIRMMHKTPPAYVGIPTSRGLLSDGVLQAVFRLSIFRIGGVSQSGCLPSKSNRASECKVMDTELASVRCLLWSHDALVAVDEVRNTVSCRPNTIYFIDWSRQKLSTGRCKRCWHFKRCKRLSLTG